MASKEKHEQLAQKVNNEDNTKCKHCKKCKTYSVCRTDKEGNQVCGYTYCEGLKEFHDQTDWLFRSQGDYISSTNYVDGKYVYLHRGCIINPSNCIDHINHDKTDNRLCNLYECSQLQNNQNHNNGDSLVFHNVRKNIGKYRTSYTAYKKIGTKTITIGTYSTDIEAFGAFVDYCYKHNLEVNPHTSAFKFYDSIRSTNSQFNAGCSITGGASYDQNL